MDQLAKKIFAQLPLILMVVVFSCVYSLGLEQIPYGFFTDEATIGVTTYEFMHGEFERFVNPFLYQHNQNILGTLPIYTTAPFILFFGLSEYSVRLPGVFFGVICMILFVKILQQLKFQGYHIAAVTFMITPLVVHTTRIAWGMMQSMSLVLLGLYFFVQKKKTNTKMFLAGVCIGLSSYGYLSYIISAPIVIGCLLLPYVIAHLRKKEEWVYIASLIVGYIISLLPIMYAVMYQPAFLLRLEEKTGESSLLSIERVQMMVQNYPKYYTPHFLFLKGEEGLPGSFITRHNILGHGLLLVSSIPFILIAGFRLLYQLARRKAPSLIISFALLFFFFPIPDLITTAPEIAPYSFAISPMLILAVMFLLAYGIHEVLRIHPAGKYLMYVFMIALTIEAQFLLNSYVKYPIRSSDFWGWQWGAKPLMNYLVEHKGEYDELILTHEFNAPHVFLQFYDPEKQCTNCKLGDLGSYDANKKQLFAIRTSMLEQLEHEEKAEHFKVLESFYLPNGRREFVIGEVQRITQ